MQYVVIHTKQVTPELFVSEEDAEENAMTLTPEMFDTLIAYLNSHHPEAVLPVQISYYTGLRIGEVSGLAWQDINLEEQYLVVRRSITQNPLRKTTEIGTTKRAKVRTVDFGDKLASILRETKKHQELIEKAYGDLYQRCFYPLRI